MSSPLLAIAANSLQNGCSDVFSMQSLEAISPGCDTSRPATPQWALHAYISGQTQLKWQPVSGATFYRVNAGVSYVNSSAANMTLPGHVNQVKVMACRGSNFGDTCSFPITAKFIDDLAKPEFDFPSAEQYTFMPDDTPVLQWQVRGAYQVILQHGSQVIAGSLPSIGEKVLSADTGLPYTLIAKGLSGDTVKTVWLKSKVLLTSNEPASSRKIDLTALGINIVTRTLLPIGNEQVVFVDESNMLHKIEVQNGDPRLIQSEPLLGKTVNRPLLFRNKIYFGSSNIDGTGAACVLNVSEPSSMICHPTQFAIIASPVAISSYRLGDDDTYGASQDRTLGVESSIVYVDFKGNTIEYSEGLTRVRQRGRLPGVLLNQPIISTPAVNYRDRSLFFNHLSSVTSGNRLLISKISLASSSNGNASLLTAALRVEEDKVLFTEQPNRALKGRLSSIANAESSVPTAHITLQWTKEQGEGL
ncbi:hypothetical protein AC626_12155 [Pseudoalteromonas rubra]|uniref:Uncharacterized protein n=2 Tax=Pseudoalteromonas TaxID=53246 RepID=A0A0L0ES89_9GAMM|nr:hypothetical protein AC626_12155 [Pseudoalteromonas rubra]